MKYIVNRRHFINHLVKGASGIILISQSKGCEKTLDIEEQAWNELPSILARIVPPTFPANDFVITNYGAIEGGTEIATEFIQHAVDVCHEAGGGRVVVPTGIFLTGPIHLKSNVNLHIAEGATLKFSTRPSDYLPAVYTRWEGVELMNYSPLIYAFEQENVALTGTGTIDGQATDTNWWPWKGREEYGWTETMPEQSVARDRLFKMAEEGIPVEDRKFGEGDYLRPSFVEFYGCQNVLIEGITILRSPMWLLHPTLCTNVTVKGVKAISHGPNNDGCDPESCSDVLIEDCFFDTGDDCIALKSGRNADGRRLAKPIENVVVRNCTMRDGHGGIVIGSEMSGGARQIFAENCEMDSPNLDRVLRIKTNSVRGGYVKGVYMRNVKTGQVADAVIRVNFLYEEGDAGEYNPVVEDISVRNVSSQKSNRALFLAGYADSPIRNINLVDCQFSGVERENLIEHVEGLEMINVLVNGQLVNT